MKLCLIRHAEIPGNTKGKIISATDFELTEKGILTNHHTYQLIRLNDHSHLKELKTAGYESWGLFVKRGYLKSIK